MSAKPETFPAAIRASRKSIYDPIEIGESNLWVPTPQLELLLQRELFGLSLHGLPLRTRSKKLKEAVCRALGYPIPTTFKKTQPRFPGQQFDTYVQKSNNLQIWNEELSPTRRYVLVRLNSEDIVSRVKVVTGTALAKLDTTGTLTQKYQARLVLGSASRELISAQDTTTLRPLATDTVDLSHASPVDDPRAGAILSIEALFARLGSLVGSSFADTGSSQDRNRGAALHRLAGERLGYLEYADTGQFPDIRHQLLEVKLQTASTIDLGLVCPDSDLPLEMPLIQGVRIRHCDTRYALIYGTTDRREVRLTHLFLTTGEDFFSRFPRFGGKVLNKKLQIPLPANLFNR